MDAKELAGAEKPCAWSCDNFDNFLLDWCRLRMLSEELRTRLVYTTYSGLGLGLGLGGPGGPERRIVFTRYY